jgi:UDP-N-acetylmuramoylalanine--D-glutamate ligase
MSSYKDFFAHKRITVMGLGLLGRGVGDVEFLAQLEADVIVTDTKTESELNESVTRLSNYPNITYHLGGHTKEDFTDADMIIKAAGVRLDSPYIALARKAGVPVYMSTALFAQFASTIGATVVGITGTRGKSTTTHMMYHVLKRNESRRVHLGGNVRGVSTLAQIPDIQKGDIVILELDSWQLQGFGDLEISPNIAVFTNLLPDHQNYYANMDEYFEDKANIFSHQKMGDTLVVGLSIASRIVEALPPGREAIIPDMLPPDWKLKIPGAHNRENAALAADALRALGLIETEIKNGLETFEGVEGRLQMVREINGVYIYNDNNATTPDATIAALSALDDGSKHIILICGGADKGLDMSSLLYKISTTCKRVICLPGTGTTRITPFMQDYSIYDSIDAAVHEAIQSAGVGDVILFSPAFASFGMFKNEYHRNDQFMNIIKNL